jgi:phosphate starvation-inducible protein PhoH
MGRAALLINNDYEEIRPVPKKKTTKTNQKLTTLPSTKAASHFSLRKVTPLTHPQRQMIESFAAGVHVIAEGSAGTGKSYVAMYLALEELVAKNISSVKIVRSAVPTREMGFLPGSLAEKTAIYELPYKDIVNDLMECGTAYESLTKKGSIEFMTTSYLRGLTFNDCVIVIDEFQSMTPKECYTLLTRVGRNCKVILCGDTKQCDLKNHESGFNYLMSLASKLSKYIDVVHFTTADIVRSEFVKALIIAEEDV